jgi:DNA repair exonuclease SbcCD ATPase subunit
MDLKNSKIFNSQTMQAVSAFCESQEIKDIDNFIYLCFKQGFDIKKYGLLGKTLNEGEKDLKTVGVEEKQLIKEIIVEKLVEVPVEVIKKVEKIVEVIKEIPVEVIKEVEKIVTKIEYISDKTTENELLLKIQQLEEEISKKDNELDELRQKLDDPVTNNKVNMLQETLQNLRNELQQKNEQIKELEKINRDFLNGNQNQAYLLKGSNLNRKL